LRIVENDKRADAKEGSEKVFNQVTVPEIWELAAQFLRPAFLSLQLGAVAQQTF